MSALLLQKSTNPQANTKFRIIQASNSIKSRRKSRKRGLFFKVEVQKTRVSAICKGTCILGTLSKSRNKLGI